MTTTLTAPDAATSLPAPAPTHALTRTPSAATRFGRAVKSEWIKTYSLRTNLVLALSTLAVIIGFGVLAAYISTTSSTSTSGNGGPNGGFSGGDPLSTVLAGANLAVLILIVLAGLAGSREFGSGMIRTTVAAVPKRLSVLWAKLLTMLVIVVPVVVVGVLVAFLAGNAVLSDGGAASLSLSDDGVVRALIGEMAYLSAVAVLGLSLGIIFRSTASSLGIMIGGLLILPGLAALLLPDSWSGVLEYLPSNAGSAVTALTPTDSLLSPTGGAITLIAWVVALVGLAAVRFKTRDV